MSPSPDYIGPYARRLARRPQFSGRRDHFGHRRRAPPERPAPKGTDTQRRQAYDRRRWFNVGDVVAAGGYLLSVTDVRGPIYAGQETFAVSPFADLAGPFAATDERRNREAEITLFTRGVSDIGRRWSQAEATIVLSSLGLVPFESEE